MGNTCTGDDGGVGRDGHIPFYDIRTRGCPSDPSEYFTSTVSADVKRRYVLDHIRYTVAQRRKDQAFSRPSEPPALGPENIHISHLADSTNISNEAKGCSADVVKEESEWGMIREALKLLSAEAEAKGLADPFQPHLLDKKRVVPELEEVTHERIVAALVRAKESIEAAFLLPMEAMVVEPEVKHSYQGGANASPSGGILKKAHRTEEDSASSPEIHVHDSPLSEQNKTSDKQATVNLKDEANAEGEMGSPAESPSPPPYPVRVSHTCIPWQVTRLSWLATLELITMDTGGQLLPGQAKHPANKNRRPSNEQFNDKNVAVDEQQEFSMLRGVGETTDEPSPYRGGPPAGSRRPIAVDLIQTPSSTVEVAHASFPIDNSVVRMVKWSEERAKMAMRYAAAAATRHQTKTGGGNSLKGKKAAVTETEVSEQQDTQLSHYRASLLARSLVSEERLRKLYAMIATRPLVPYDHPLFGGGWANPSHPRVRALLAARWPALSCACESRTQGQASHSLRAVKGDAQEGEEDSRCIAAAVSELIEMQTEHSRTMGIVPQGDPTNAARSDPLSSCDNFNAALLHQLRRNVDGLGAMASNSASIREKGRAEAGAGSTEGSSTQERRTNEVPTNRNAHRHTTKPSKDDHQTYPHSPYCLCQTCLDDLWTDVDLRHLVSWPPTACVARPTIAVLSHTSAVEAVMIVPSPSTSAAPSVRRRRGAAARRAENNEYSDGEGVDGLEEDLSSSEGMRDFIFKPLSTAEAASEAGASSDTLQLVRHHKATVAVLFYHHRLKSSNALQRKLLSEDTVSVPLLQPEASASSSMLLGKSRDRDDSPLMARKARLQMLSNYRDLRTQHLASEAERRRKLSNGISLNSGASGGAGNTSIPIVLPQLLQSLATSVSSGVWFDRTFAGVAAQRVDLSAAAMAIRRGLAAGEDGQTGKRASTLTPIAAVATQHGVVGAGEGGPTILLRSSAQTSSEAGGGQRAEGGRIVASAEATVFHANDLPFFPPRASSCSFSSSRADEELFVTEARVPPHQASPLGGLTTGSNAKDIGPHLRDITSSQKLRLDAVDLVVEALVIELEAFELITPDEAASDMRNGCDLSAEGASLVCRLHPSVSHSHAYSSSEVSLLSTLAPALDLRDMARCEGIGRQQDGNGGVVFREPNVMTQAAAKGAFNKQTLRAERRREFDADDFVNGKNFKPDSKAQEGKEDVKTSLAIKMMASHYQSLLDEERGTDRTQNSQQESNALGTQWLSRYSQHDMSQYQSFIAQVASQVQSEIWMKDLFPL